MSVSNAVKAKAAITWVGTAKPDQKFQFERHDFFVADRADHVVSGKVVFNRVTRLKDSWGK